MTFKIKYLFYFL